jgi:hypothetical protein
VTISMAASNIARIQRDIASLRDRDAQEAKREADAHSKVNRSMASARSTSSQSSIGMYMREAERAQQEIASISSKRAGLARDLASKTNDLHRYERDLRAGEERERKKQADDNRKAQADRDRQIRDLERRLATQAESIRLSAQADLSGADVVAEHDAFISHASEDKDDFVRLLAEKMRLRGMSVWYDEFSLGWGDSLRRKIDQGLASSRFGIVVLSENFFKKEWPQKELDGLVALEMAGRSRILPIWHKISKDEVAKYSPTLADKLALNTAVMTVDEIIDELAKTRASIPS